MKQHRLTRAAQRDESRPPMSRRDAIVAGAAALVGGLVAGATGPAPAHAQTGDDFRVGNLNFAKDATYLGITPDGNYDSGTMALAQLAGRSYGVRGDVYDTSLQGAAGVAGAANAAGRVGVYAVAGQDAWALKVDGRTRFSRSGIESIRPGQSSVLVSVPSGLSATSSILCTMQNYAGGGVMMMYAAKVDASHFKIQLNAKCTKRAYFAWMVLDVNTK